MQHPRRSYAIPLLVAAFSLMLTGSVLLAEGPEALLAALPALLLVGALACNRYPGEKLLQRLARRRPQRRPARAISPRIGREPVLGRALLLLSGTRSLRGPPLLSSLSI